MVVVLSPEIMRARQVLAAANFWKAACTSPTARGSPLKVGPAGAAEAAGRAKAGRLRVTRQG